MEGKERISGKRKSKNPPLKITRMRHPLKTVPALNLWPTLYDGVGVVKRHFQ
jgi:hypothetical protein